MHLLFALLIGGAAEAGWFIDFCERHLIADDPYEHEATPGEYIDRRLEALSIRRGWRPLEEKEAVEMVRLERELRRREALRVILALPPAPPLSF